MSAVYPPQGSFAFPRPASPAAAARHAPAAAAAHDGFALAASFPSLPQTGGAGRGPGLAVVVLLHLLLAWALASGLARKVVEIVKKPIEMSIIDEAPPPPPPPPPPPKIEKIKEVPKVKLPPPPPAYVPPPEVVTQPPPAPVIQAVQAEPPKEPVVIAPPPPPAPPPEPAKPEIVKQEISLACPGYQSVLASTLEEAFDRVGIVGTVRTLIKVRGNQVVEAVPQSGPKEYYKYVQTAIKRMRCSASGAEEVLVSLDVAFRK